MLIPSTAEIELAGQSEPDRQGIGLPPVGLRGFSSATISARPHRPR